MTTCCSVPPQTPALFSAKDGISARMLSSTAIHGRQSSFWSGLLRAIFVNSSGACRLSHALPGISPYEKTGLRPARGSRAFILFAPSASSRPKPTKSGKPFRCEFTTIAARPPLVERVLKRRVVVLLMIGAEIPPFAPKTAQHSRKLPQWQGDRGCGDGAYCR